MKTSTQAQILAYIKEEGTTTAKSIISYIGFSPQIVFRHLKKLIGVGLIKKTGLPPRVEYFVNSLEGRSALESKVYYKNMTPLHWAQNEKPTDPPSEFYCPATDVWQGRFDRIAPTLIRKKFEPELVSLVASAIGEIGDNCFTHNAPGWIDTRGAWFEFDLTDNNLHVIIADRGRGILKSLQAVRPSLQLHRDALFTALTELGVTGRAPELRGNGLKHAMSVLARLPAGNFRFQTGDAVFECTLPLDKNKIFEQIKQAPQFIRGTCCEINITLPYAS